MRTKPRNKPNSSIIVSKAELEKLIEAKVERDLILYLASDKDCRSYQLDSLLKALLRLNGITTEGGADA